MIISSKIIINKPVKEVWDFFDNPDNMHLWLTGLKGFKPITTPSGKVGARAKDVNKQQGSILEITKREEFKKFSGFLSHQSMDSTIDTNFEDINNKRTSLICLIDVKFKSAFLKLFGKMKLRSLQKRQDKDFKTLKSIIESK